MDDRKDCCKIPGNLKCEETGRQELAIVRCQVCKCRHFEMTVDPSTVGVLGNKMGG